MYAMALFNFFGIQEHRVYDHKPMYYDPKKEERRRYFGAVDGSDKKEDYVPGSMVRGSMRDSSYQNTNKTMKRVTTIISVITIVLIILTIWFILKLYPYLFVQ